MPIRTQDAYEPASKHSTRFLARGGNFSEVSVDLSQWETDATDNTTYMDMSSPDSDRLNLDSPRTITVVASLDNTHTGILFTHGSGANLLQLDINTAGVLRAIQNNTTVATLAIPGVDASNYTFVMSWATRDNPLTTGASDARQSWLYILDTRGDTVARTEFFHDAKTGSGATATWGPFGGTITGVSHESRCQSLTEIATDWQETAPVAPRTSCDVEVAPVPLDDTMPAGDENYLYGPVTAWAARHASHARRRTWSPLANIVYRTQNEIESTTPSGSPWYRLVPGDDTYYLGMPWIVPAPVPTGATHAFVRMHLQTWVTSGAAVPIGLRVYSMSRLPDADDEGELEVQQIGEVVTRDDTASGDGEWTIEGLLRLAVSADGWTILCPAFAFDPAGASANDANARITIRALQAVPCYAETEGGA